MKGLEFPIISTKVKGLTKKFDIESPKGRRSYFEAKVGDEVSHISKFLQNNTFVAYLIGKKSSGKGTYSKLFAEIFGEDKIAHVSVGDLIREADDWEKFKSTEKYKKAKNYYRGYVSWEEAVDAHLGRSVEKLLPTEFILALLKAHIDELSGKAVFIDGMPRNMDQISYSLYFRDLINFRHDPDMFILIDIAESIIEERMKYRVICPKCNTSRSTKLLITSKIEYQPAKADEDEGTYYLVCDNPSCSGVRMMPKKEGDKGGLDAIRGRLDTDEELLRKAFKLHGVPKVLLRNHIPVGDAKEKFDDYEITPEFVLKYNKKSKKVEVSEKPFVVLDDNGKKVNSLMAPAVVVCMIKQMVEVLDL